MMLRRIVVVLIVLGIVAIVLPRGGTHADPALNRAIGMTLHNVQGDPSQVPNSPFNDRSHTCIGEKAVAALGEGRIRQLGIDQDSAAEVFRAPPPLTRHGLTETEIDALLDAVDQCIPFHEIWVFLAMNARNTEELIKTEDQRNQLAACLTETPGRQAVRDAWKILFTQPVETFNATFAQHHEESMTCYAEVFCGPAYVGSVITPGLFQTMITEGACPF